MFLKKLCKKTENIILQYFFEKETIFTERNKTEAYRAFNACMNRINPGKLYQNRPDASGYSG